jgi:hypothetical protein
VAEGAEAARVQWRDGRLYITREVHDACLAGCPALALLARDGQWLLLPLLGGAGGLQVKIRNARGDRVVESQEFFRRQGLEDDGAPRDFVLAAVPGSGGFELITPDPS